MAKTRVIALRKSREKYLPYRGCSDVCDCFLTVNNTSKRTLIQLLRKQTWFESLKVKNIPGKIYSLLVFEPEYENTNMAWIVMVEKIQRMLREVDTK